MVAPGMTCQYVVQFLPDCLGDFDDFILVETQSAHTLLIPLQARRLPPVLTLSPVLDCGYCLIGGMKVTRFLCKNVGFSVGRFCVMPKKSWPPPSFRVSDHKLLPGKRAAPTKEIIPCEGLAGARLWLETHGKQNFRTSLFNCHNPSGNETQCIWKRALQFWLFH